MLASAIMRREREYSAALDTTLGALEENLETYVVAEKLREAIELCRCLRRLVPDCDVRAIHRAFGAPGDFGYETPIGEALSRVYRGE